MPGSTIAQTQKDPEMPSLKRRSQIPWQADIQESQHPLRDLQGGWKGVLQPLMNGARDSLPGAL